MTKSPSVRKDPTDVRSAFSRLPAALELHRRGVGLLPDPGETAGGLPIWVQLDAQSLPLRICGCTTCKKKKRTCERVRGLNQSLAPLAEDLASGLLEQRIDRSFWMRLAKQLAGDAPV